MESKSLTLEKLSTPLTRNEINDFLTILITYLSLVRIRSNAMTISLIPTPLMVNDGVVLFPGLAVAGAFILGELVLGLIEVPVMTDIFQLSETDVL